MTDRESEGLQPDPEAAPKLESSGKLEPDDGVPTGHQPVPGGSGVPMPVNDPVDHRGDRHPGPLGPPRADAGHGGHVDADHVGDAVAGPESRKRSKTGRRPRWKAVVDRAVQDLTSRLKEQHGQLLADDDHAREFKKYIVRRIKADLPPGPGRPPNAAITKAMQLRDQGVSWGDVCLECIPDFNELPIGKRQVLKSELRSRCRSRRNTARRRKSVGPPPGEEGRPGRS